MTSKPVANCSRDFVFYFLLNLLIEILTCLCVILGVAYYTVLERKVLSYSQTRKGPNKAGFIGLAQPLADALKLFIKEGCFPHGRNPFVFVFAPALALILALSLWHLYPSDYGYRNVIWGLLLFFCITALNVYGTLLAG